MSNVRRSIWLIGISALAVGLAACASQAPTPAPVATPKPPAAAPAAVQPTAAPKPVAVAPTAVPVAPTAASKPAGQVLVAQFADLNRVIAVQSSQAFIGKAGFHAMAEDLDKAKEIKSSYLGTTRNVLTVANAVPWPADLAKEQGQLVKNLKTLEAALVANKLQDAAKAADAVHEAEHDFSKAAFAWMGQRKLGQVDVFKAQGDGNHLLGCTGVQSAQAYVSGAGFHAMAEDLEKAKEIKSSYLGTTRNVLTVANAVPWPADLAKEQGQLVKNLKTLEAALVANKLQDAAKAADAVHEAEHDFSKATFAWMGGLKHDFTGMMPMMMGDKMMQGAMTTGVQSAQAYVSGAGFHAMAEDLEKAKEIKSSYLGTTRNVLTVANAVPWPADLAKEQGQLVKNLKTLEAALVANKLQDAAKAADAVHEAEHDFSKATFAWMGKVKL